MNKEGPFLGDIRLVNPEDRGKPWREITDFEVWDGTRWVHSSEANKPMNVQVSS